MRQKQAEGAKGGIAGRRKNDAVDQKNALRSGSSNAASTKKATSPSSSSEPESTLSTGTSKISELRNALMGSLKRNQAAARDANQWRSGRRGEGEVVDDTNSNISKSKTIGVQAGEIGHK